MSKTCRKCNVDKPFDLFNKCSASKDGCHTWCRDCHRQHARMNKPIYEAKMVEKMRLKKLQDEEEHLRFLREKEEEKTRKDDNFHKQRDYLSSVARGAISSIWWQSR